MCIRDSLETGLLCLLNRPDDAGEIFLCVADDGVAHVAYRGGEGTSVPLETIMGQMGTVSSPRVQVVRLSHPQCCSEFLFHRPVDPCCLAPCSALGLGAMHQDGKGSRGEAVTFVNINRQT